MLALLTFVFVPAAASGADLSRDIRTADDAAPFKSAIDQYIQGQVGAIGQDDPKASSQARDSLVDEVRGLVPPSGSFLDTYSAELQTLLVPLTAPAVSIRVRLNAAIVVARIANSTQDAGLAQLVITELNDPSEAVVLWALKAAHEVIPPALNVATLKLKLIAAVTSAAQRLGTGPIVAAAYNALASSNKTTLPAAIAGLITPVQNLLNWRLQQYNGAVPPEPPADARATDFLTERDVWFAAPQQQKSTVQLVVKLIAAAVTSQATAQPEDHDELMVLLKKLGEAIYVIGFNTSNQALEAAATPLSHIDQRPPPMPPLQAASLAVSGLAANFPGLVIPKPFSTAVTAPAAGLPAAVKAAP